MCAVKFHFAETDLLSILTFLAARSCESSWTPAQTCLMVTGHPHLALTPLGTGCAVGPREAGWDSTCAHYHLSLAFQASLLPLSLWYSSPRPAHRLTFITPGSPPAGLTLTAARHVVATRTMDAVATLLTALSKESLGTGFGQKGQTSII